MHFTIHPKLAADTYLIGELPLSSVLLMNDARYPWVILVPRVPDATEIHMLSESDQQQLIKESSSLSEFILEHFPVTKMNVAVLGNIVPQLHVHHIGRNEKDPAWPGPVWGHSEAEPYTPDKASKTIDLFQTFLATGNK